MHPCEIIKGIGGAIAFALIAAMSDPAHGGELCGHEVAETGPANRVFTATEGIEPGALVTFVAGGIANATAANDQRPAQGFVACRVRKGDMARVFGPGDTIPVHGLTPGGIYRLAAEPGAITDGRIGAQSRQIYQTVGTAIAPDALIFLPQEGFGE